MKRLVFPKDLSPRSGEWTTIPDINVTSLEKGDIYRAEDEPSYVSWAILWKEQSGDLKLSFVEATGDKRGWPPVYNFNSRDITYYLKTLVSEDGGASWRDTGWREDLDKVWEKNPDHHIRHVFQLPDGRLIRNYCHTVEGETALLRDLVYDEARDHEGQFAFRAGEKHPRNVKFASIWTSGDGGKSWKEIHLFEKRPPLFITAIHPLKDGTIVAMGAIGDSFESAETARAAVTESTDGGKTWSEPVVIAENDDRLNPQGIGEECDFVELDDGRLLVIWRTDAGGSFMRQLYLQRDEAGLWRMSNCQVNSLFLHSGYPYMLRASDGTVFYYCHTAIKYSCDNGVTWQEFPSGPSYYGQMTEIAPGKILAVTQRNIFDCPYPWKYDTSMFQTVFDYERTGVVRHMDEEAGGACADLNVGQCSDFHVAAELTVDGASGFAYQVDERGCRFAALTMPANASRVSPEMAEREQHVYLQIGRMVDGKTELLRKIHVGKLKPGEWAELQVCRQGETVKAAANLYAGNRSLGVYTCVRDENPRRGAVSLYASRSLGAFRNVRFSAAPQAIRDNWYRERHDFARQLK